MLWEAKQKVLENIKEHFYYLREIFLNGTPKSINNNNKKTEKPDYIKITC